MINILNLGAGVQSTTVFYMAVFGLVPKFDYIIFADTGWEPDDVYKHLNHLDGIAYHHGMEIIRVSNGNIREGITKAQVAGKKTNGVRFASMPLHLEDGGMIRRQCTSEYKITPIDRFLKGEVLNLEPRARFPKEQKIRQWFGISMDEAQRLRVPKDPWRSFVYPLCDLESFSDGRVVSLGLKSMRRGDCLTWLKNMGLSAPPRSACIGCPFRSNAEWRRIKAKEREWKDAVEVDGLVRQMAGMRKKAYLHKSCVPLEEANISKGNDSQIGLLDECQGYCGN